MNDPASDRVEQLVILTERLTGMVAEQAKCFENRRPQDAAALADADPVELARSVLNELAELAHRAQDLLTEIKRTA